MAGSCRGIAYYVDRRPSISGNFEYHLGKRVTYTTPELPFGVDTLARKHYLGATVMATYRWR